MKQFKISKIVPLLLSVIVVTGVFAAENFKNSIMAIEFEPVSDGEVNMVISTKVPFSGTINPIKKDANTYVIMLPDTQSVTSSADYSKAGSISSVNVRTMAGNQNSPGYTKITVATAAPINLTSKNTIYKPKEENNTNNINNYIPASRETYQPENYYESSSAPVSRSSSQTSDTSVSKEKTNPKRKSSDYSSQNSSATASDNNNIQNEQVSTQSEPESKKNSDEIFLIVMGILLIITCSAFFYVKAKNKLTQIAGESLDIDVTEETEQKPKNTDKKSVRRTISSLDKKYSNPSKMPVISEYTQPAPQMNTEKSTDDMNIVDLDELFNEHVKNSDNNNDALDDFLSEFSFEEEIPEEKTELFDEEAFQEILGNNKIRFSKSDMERIKNLLSMEINDDTLRDINKYAVSNPIKQTKPNNLENMVATLSISHNVSFDKDDIIALHKLMNVEIDKDFVTDLRTDPARTEEMRKQIEETFVERKKPSEIITLSVSDMLPDLEDVMKHPEKYEEAEPERIVVNAEDLLKTIENVSFKPFDDGTRDFEILNDFDDKPVAELYSEDYTAENTFLSELEAEPAKHEPAAIEPMPAVIESDKPKPAEQKPVENKPVQQKPIQPKPVEQKTIESKPAPQKKVESGQPERRAIAPRQPERRPIESKPTERKTIASRQSERRPITSRTTERRPIEQRRSASKLNELRADNKSKVNIKCLLNGKTYDVVSSVALGTNIGCHLAKGGEGYVVIQYYENKLSIIKEYKNLKSEKIQARLSEKNPDGSLRYIIRIGLAKFIADVNKNCVTYVMDL